MERYDSKYGKLFLLSLAFVFISCGNDPVSDEFDQVKTVVKGNVSDIQRNIDISNFEIKLVRSWSCGSLGGSGLCMEEVASVFTDELGNYEIEFNFIMDGKDYLFEKVYYGDPYHTEYVKDYSPIIPGEENIRNIDAWRPVKIKLNLQIRNNNNPPLLTDNKIVESDYFDFPQVSIHEKNTDTIIYLDSKPNSSVELNFHYTTGNTNSDYHSKKELVQTNLQDTIAYSFQINCSDF